MGKRYYCDYCDKTMSCAPSIIKTHNSGLAHQKLVQEHYQRYKDPETIVSEESKKTQCNRFFSGECRFGTICRYSHYSTEQIEALKCYVATKNLAETIVTKLSFQDLYNNLQKEKMSKQDNDITELVDQNGITHVLPWTYNSVLENYDLPPSIRKFTLEDFEKASLSSWGYRRAMYTLRFYNKTPSELQKLSISFDQVVPSNTITDGNYTSNQTQIYEWLFQTGIKAEGFDGWKMMYPFKINGEYVPYMEPNLTIFRRIFNIGLEFIRKVFRGDVKTEQKPKGSDVYLSGDTKIKENEMTPTRRATHEAKLNEIIKFCKDKHLTTNYFYDEMKRIIAHRVVKDDLRYMVTNLENPKHVSMKNKVLNYYKRLLATEAHIINTGADHFDTNKFAITLSNNY